MGIASGIGAQLLAAPPPSYRTPWWFGEDQARYIVTVRAEDAGRVLAKMKGRRCAVRAYRHHRRRYDRDLRRSSGLDCVAQRGLRGLVPGYRTAARPDG